MNAAVPHNRCPTGLLQGPIASSQPLAVPSNVDLRLLFVMQDYAQQGAMDPDMAIVVDRQVNVRVVQRFHDLVDRLLAVAGTWRDERPSTSRASSTACLTLSGFHNATPRRPSQRPELPFVRGTLRPSRH